MRTKFLTVAAFLLISGFVFAQAPAPESVKAELRAFVGELNAAMAAKDKAALERLYAPDFLFVHALGEPIDRATHIANALASTAKIPPLPIPSFDDLVVSGDFAFIRRRDDSRYSVNMYTKASGHWQVLHMQGTPIPTTKTAATLAPGTMRMYAGRYQQSNGLFTTITLEGGQLFLQVDERQKLALVPVSQQKFDLPGGAGSITFAADGASYDVLRNTGEQIRGTKQ